MQLDFLGLLVTSPAPTSAPIPATVPSGHDHPGGWSAYKAEEDAEIAETGVEELCWGKPNGTPSYQLTLWHSRAGWRFKESYSFANSGGGGPFRLEVYPTRIEAVLAAFRSKMVRLARAVISSWTIDSERAQCRALAAWMIAQCPPMLSGGVDLAEDWAALQAAEDWRETRRLQALRAAYDVKDQVEAIAKDLGVWSYHGGGCEGSLQAADLSPTGNDRAEGRAGTVWPARWSIGGHAPDALELHTYPAEGQAASPVLQAFLGAVRAALSIPIREHGEGWTYPLAAYTWDDS